MEREPAKLSCKSYTLAFSYKGKQKGVKTGKVISQEKKIKGGAGKLHVEAVWGEIKRW